jgi:hypothetical protein
MMEGSPLRVLRKRSLNKWKNKPWIILHGSIILVLSLVMLYFKLTFKK